MAGANVDAFNFDLDYKFAVFLYGVVGWFTAILYTMLGPISTAGLSFLYFTSAAHLVDMILYWLVWGVVGILWLLTLFLDVEFISWLFQFWIVISWAGVFGANWIGALILLFGWIISDEPDMFGWLIMDLIIGGGASFVTIWFGADARDEIKTWYDEANAPESDFVDNVESTGDDAEAVGDDISNDGNLLIRF